MLLVVAAGLLGRGAALSMRHATRISLALARVAGYVIAQQWSHDEPRVLAVIEPRSGAWRTLWPAGQVVNGEWQPATPFAGYIWLTAPAYAPATRTLAFTARDSAGGASIWVAPIAFGADGWPVIAAPGPRKLVADCRPCDTLAWSPSGQWLLFNGPAGLAALSPTSLQRQSVTATVGDQWPACAADGRWLAYQRRWGDLVALPARDCLPLANAWSQARYLEGFAPAWRPAWSPDGRWLAFVSALGGPWSVYVVAYDALARTPNIGARDTSYLESSGGCTDPVWARRDPPGGDVLLYGCDAPTADNHHGSLLIVPAGPQPAWEAVLGSGIMNRDSLCWVPAPA
jgi:Tol biopolymer transport system component